MRHRILLFILFVVCSAFLYGQENILICSKQVSNSVDKSNEILQKNEAYISVDFVDINLDKILEYMLEEDEGFGELRESVKASAIWEVSLGDWRGPKMRRSLSSDGVKDRGKDISLSSGKEQSRGGNWGGIFFLRLWYGSNGSFSIWVLFFYKRKLQRNDLY